MKSVLWVFAGALSPKRVQMREENPVLLIFGLSVFFRTVDEGMFHCPHCGGDRAYRLRSGRRWLTVFFLPVIPLGHIGEAVQCNVCRTRFNRAVLRLPTTVQMAASLPAGMRAAAGLVLAAGDPDDDGARQRAVETVRGYGDAEYDAELLDEDIALATVEDPAARIIQVGGQLAVEAKEWFLAQAVRIALVSGPLSDEERTALHRVAQALGMTPAHALGVIVTTEGAAR